MADKRRGGEESALCSTCARDGYVRNCADCVAPPRRQWHVNIGIEDGRVVEVAVHSAPGSLVATIGGRHWLTWFGGMTYEQALQTEALARKTFLPGGGA